MLKSLKAAGDMWKFRWRMALALRATAPNVLASADELNVFVAQQVASWAKLPLEGAAAHQGLCELNDRSFSAFVFSIRGSSVRIWKKLEIAFPAEDAAARRREQRTFLRRAALYQAFFETTLRCTGTELSIDFAVDMNDIPEESNLMPLFGFQRMRGARNPLLPDVDFFHSKWYLSDHDTIPYEKKLVSACFVGSSTGGWLSVESIRNGEIPRLRAAAYFQGNPKVLFRIANAVQCRSEEAKAELMSQPYFSEYVRWEDQLQYRFIISIDGNGAACSRLVKGLRSNSAVVKFDSQYELYYFSALKPDQDYLLVKGEDELIRIVDRELARPGTFETVAKSGQRFADKYLTIWSVMAYTARLLSAFSTLAHR